MSVCDLARTFVYIWLRDAAAVVVDALHLGGRNYILVYFVFTFTWMLLPWLLSWLLFSVRCAHFGVCIGLCDLLQLPEKPIKTKEPSSSENK